MDDLDALQNYVNAPNGNIGAYVITGRCAKCRKPTFEEWVVAMGPPYNCVLHPRCVPLFRFDGMWPHPKAAVEYKLRRRSSPPLLHTSTDEQHF